MKKPTKIDFLLAFSIGHKIVATIGIVGILVGLLFEYGIINFIDKLKADSNNFIETYLMKIFICYLIFTFAETSQVFCEFFPIFRRSKNTQKGNN